MNIKTDIENYERDGFLIVRGAVTGEPLQQLERELAGLRDGVESGILRGNHLMERNKMARVIFDPYDHSPALRELTGRADMIERAKAMLGTGIHLHHTKLM